MSAKIALIFSSASVLEVAEAMADAAESLSAEVRLRRVPGADGPADHGEATLDDLEWADGIGFGTPVAPGHPSAALMSFVNSAGPMGERDVLYDKVVTLFTDEPEVFAPQQVLYPIWEAAYKWGAVMIGPRASELELDAREHRGDIDQAADGSLSGPRKRTAGYRGRRLTRLAGLLASERARRRRLEL